MLGLHTVGDMGTGIKSFSYLDAENREAYPWTMATAENRVQKVKVDGGRKAALGAYVLDTEGALSGKSNELFIFM